MTVPFSFAVRARDGSARVGAIATPRGVVRTPAFMPVGTGATVKAMFPEDVASAGADILLANTYHLMLRPGAERIAKLGGLTASCTGRSRSSPIPAAIRSCRWRSSVASTRRASPFNRISTARP